MNFELFTSNVCSLSVCINKFITKCLLNLKDKSALIFYLDTSLSRCETLSLVNRVIQILAGLNGDRLFKNIKVN